MVPSALGRTWWSLKPPPSPPAVTPSQKQPLLVPSVSLWMSFIHEPRCKEVGNFSAARGSGVKKGEGKIALLRKKMSQRRAWGIEEQSAVVREESVLVMIIPPLP